MGIAVHNLLLSLQFASFVCLLKMMVVSSEMDFYQVLGVNRTASVQEIKRAYRRKARDTHPDKRIDISPKEAAEEFHRVVHAFEILSDEESRKQYDLTGATGRNRNENQGTSYYYDFWRRQYTGRSQRRSDRLDVKLAMSRVIQIVSLQQLETIMLDENDLLERSLLLCFVTPGTVEDIAHEDMIFPFPFAHLSEEGIWWEDLLQTAEIRIARGNQLNEFFNMPDPDRVNTSRKPIFLFAKRGFPLELEWFSRMQTNHYNQWKRWVWRQMAVTVEFVNHHPYSIDGFLANKGFGQPIFTLLPEDRRRQQSMVGHQWWFRDQRVDTLNVMIEGMLCTRWALNDEVNLQLTPSSSHF